MNKPTLTREQSSALEYILKRNNKSDVLRWHCGADLVWCGDDALSTIDTLTMAAALVNGWETKKSPIEELRDEYDRQSKRRLFEPHSDIWCRAVVSALNATGQVIEGINA